MVRYGTSGEFGSSGDEQIAMSAVGKGLNSLDDPEARKRVLRWANERFQPEVPVPGSSIPLSVEPELTDDRLDDIFEERPAVAAPALHVAPGPDPSVDRLHDVFGAPARTPAARPLAHARHTASDRLEDMFPEPASPPPAVRLAPVCDLAIDGLDDLFEEPVGPQAAEIAEDELVLVRMAAEDLSDLYEPPSEPARPHQLDLVPSEELPFDRIVDDFVDSLERLSREWQTV